MFHAQHLNPRKKYIMWNTDSAGAQQSFSIRQVQNEDGKL